MRFSNYLRTMSAGLLIGSMLLAGGMAAYSSQQPQTRVKPAVYQVETPAAPAVKTVNAAQPGGNDPFVPPVEAGVGGALSGRTYRVQLTADGFLPGRIVLLGAGNPEGTPVRDIEVHFVQRRQIVKSIRAGEGGVFQVGGMVPGVYSVIARSSEAYAVFAVHVIPHQPGAAPGAASMLEINAAAVPANDFRSVGQLLAQLHGLSAGPGMVGGGGAPVGGPLGPGGGVGGGVEKATSIYTHDVNLEPNGAVSGQLVRLDPQTGAAVPAGGGEVHFIQNDQIVTTTTSGADGSFSAAGLQEGVYTVATISRTPSQGGFAALSVRVVGPGNAAAADNNPIRNASATTVLQGGGLVVGMIDSNDITPTNGDALTPPGTEGMPPLLPPFAGGYPGMGMGPGGMGGGWGPGGGLGGGDGLLGALLGAGALAAALSDDDGGDGDSGGGTPATAFLP